MHLLALQCLAGYHYWPLVRLLRRAAQGRVNARNNRWSEIKNTLAGSDKTESTLGARSDQCQVTFMFWARKSYRFTSLSRCMVTALLCVGGWAFFHPFSCLYELSVRFFSGNWIIFVFDLTLREVHMHGCTVSKPWMCRWRFFFNFWHVLNVVFMSCAAEWPIKCYFYQPQVCSLFSIDKECLVQFRFTLASCLTTYLILWCHLWPQIAHYGSVMTRYSLL